jgi:UDP-N-acetylglucosamine 2-epimerase (non-hydrolysing)
MKVLHVVGARPNYMKVAPIMAQMSKAPDRFQQLLVHTGQHYDVNMSDVFFEELGLPMPDEYLGVGSGTHAEQTARVMLTFEPVLERHKPDLVMVVGDVNSTLACALVAAKRGIPVAHVEAGLRSGDRSMPEEINRVLTDQISDLLFTTSSDADENLRREGIAPEKTHFVGNVMIDSLVRLLPEALRRDTLARLDVEARHYVLVTLHRPANVDTPDTLFDILEGLREATQFCRVVFPVHPRTRQRIPEAWKAKVNGCLVLTEPLGYLDFLRLMVDALAVVTDSGGLQEETTYLGVPCLTVRPNTERPVTITEGTNRLVPPRRDALVAALKDAIGDCRRPKRPPEFWDGKAAERIAAVLGTY